MSAANKFYTIGALGITILVILQCSYEVKEEKGSIKPMATAYDGLGYAGSKECISCHKDIYEQHLKTAHFKTSQIANKDNILGSFTSGKNTISLNNGITYEMSEIDSVPYQSATANGKFIYKAPFDIIIGSGTKGQTYLFWNEAELYQLPVSYRVKDEYWINSPGYSNDMVDFSRTVLPTCLECHTTFSKSQCPDKFRTGNAYVKEEMILGVDCESCHGPSAIHADFHINNPEAKDARHIIEIRSLSRKQRLEACGKCRSGLRNPLKPPFSFRTGDKLEDFYEEAYTEQEKAKLDVHGNQYGLLSASKCFIGSESMDCATCHNPHKNERNKPKQFSQQCLNCHQSKIAHKFNLDKSMLNNCIDCHMPFQSSSTLTFKALDPGNSDSLSVRTHRIGIYSEISDDLIEFIKKLPAS